jgi:hypothetical protein
MPAALPEFALTLLALKLLCMLATSHSCTAGSLLLLKLLLQKLRRLRSGCCCCCRCCCCGCLASLLLLFATAHAAAPAAAVTAAAAAAQGAAAAATPAAATVAVAAAAVTAHAAAAAAMVCTAVSTSLRVLWSSMKPPWMRLGLYTTCGDDNNSTTIRQTTQTSRHLSRKQFNLSAALSASKKQAGFTLHRRCC